AGMTFFAGTFVRHPLALAAARAVLSHLKSHGPGLQSQLNERAERLAEAVNHLFESESVPARLERFGSQFYLHFDSEFVFSGLLYFLLRERGVFVLENRPCFLSTAHSDADLDRIVRAFETSIEEMRRGSFLPEPGQRAPHEPQAEAEGTRAAAAEKGADAGEVAAGERKSADVLPLSESQREVWLASQMGDDASRSYNLSVIVSLNGEFELSALETAVRRLVSRHESLRTTF